MQDLLTTLISTLQTLAILLASQGGITPEVSAQIQAITSTQQTQLQIPPTQDLNAINKAKSDAVINIVCISRNDQLNSEVASGVIISPDGLVLVNAHMAQYMLLEQLSNIAMQCTLRSGSPAKPAYKAKIIYINPKWIKTNASQITSNEQYGTGEHDYAILQITNPIKPNTSLPKEFTYIEPNTKPVTSYINKPVLIRSYPAEFLGSAITLRSLHPVATITPLLSMRTFSTDAKSATPDLLELGGSIVAQGGSSGGAVISNSGKLLGIIVTSTRKNTTAERELNAISIEHINNSLKADIGIGLNQLINLPKSLKLKITANSLPASANKLLKYIK